MNFISILFLAICGKSLGASIYPFPVLPVNSYAAVTGYKTTIYKTHLTPLNTGVHPILSPKSPFLIQHPQTVTAHVPLVQHPQPVTAEVPLIQNPQPVVEVPVAPQPQPQPQPEIVSAPENLPPAPEEPSISQPSPEMPLDDETPLEVASDPADTVEIENPEFRSSNSPEFSAPQAAYPIYASG